MEVHLFGVSPADARIIAVVAVTLAVIALAAVIVPSWRASTVDPVAVLNS
jgi:ABC-type lipoprotein release transport system permease subunit